MFAESIRFTAKVLLRKPVRSLLTILQVSLGIAAVALVLNALMQPEDAFQGPTFIAPDEQLIVVQNGQVVEESGSVTGTRHYPLFTLEDLDAVSEVDGVVSVPVKQQIMLDIIEFAGMRYLIAGLNLVNEDFMDIADMPVVEGTVFSDLDFEQQSQTLVISQQAAKALFGDESPIGQKLVFTWSFAGVQLPQFGRYAREFEVIGVVDISGASGMLWMLQPGHFMAPLGAQNRTDAAREGSSPGVSIDSRLYQFTAVVKRNALDNVKRAITEMFTEKYGAGATLMFEEIHMPTGPRVDRTLSTFLGGFALVGLIVSLIGILSIMMVSSLERTREIGLRRALGATRLAVVIEILMEACMLAVIGACLGLVAASFLTDPLSALLSTNYARPVEGLKRLGLGAITASLGLSVIVGIISGLFPAIQASLRSPVEALRDTAL